MNLDVIMEKLNAIENRLEGLEKKLDEKDKINGSQDIALAKLQTVCVDRGKRLEDVEDFKDKFLFMQIASNLLTLGMAFLIFRMFGG